MITEHWIVNINHQSSKSYFFLACLRLQVNPANKSQFEKISPERAFADFIFAHLVLHLTVMNFIGWSTIGEIWNTQTTWFNNSTCWYFYVISTLLLESYVSINITQFKEKLSFCFSLFKDSTLHLDTFMILSFHQLQEVSHKWYIFQCTGLYLFLFCSYCLDLRYF